MDSHCGIRDQFGDRVESCLRPRKPLRELRQLDESQLTVEVLIGVSLSPLASLLMFLAEPPAQPGCGIAIYEPIRLCDRA